MEVMTDFLFLDFKITADGDCSHEIRRCLHLSRKAMTNLDGVLKSRDITLPTKVHIVKNMVFLVITYGWESCMVNKAECQRIDVFELWCWIRRLRVPWTARRSNQWNLREINPNTHWRDCCWSSSILVTWCKHPTHWKSPWCWEGLKAGGEEVVGGWDG